MQGEIRCEHSDIYAQAHALQSYAHCSVHGFFSARPCVLEHLHWESRTKSQASNDLDALCWYIGHKMLVELLPNYVQERMCRGPTTIFKSPL